MKPILSSAELVLGESKSIQLAGSTQAGYTVPARRITLPGFEDLVLWLHKAPECLNGKWTDLVWRITDDRTRCWIAQAGTMKKAADAAILVLTEQGPEGYWRACKSVLSDHRRNKVKFKDTTE